MVSLWSNLWEVYWKITILLFYFNLIKQQKHFIFIRIISQGRYSLLMLALRLGNQHLHKLCNLVTQYLKGNLYLFLSYGRAQFSVLGKKITIESFKMKANQRTIIICLTVIIINNISTYKNRWQNNTLFFP